MSVEQQVSSTINNLCHKSIDDQNTTPINMDVNLKNLRSADSVTTASSMTESVLPDQMWKQKYEELMSYYDKIPTNSSGNMDEVVGDVVRENIRLRSTVDLYEQQNMYWIEKSKSTNSYSSKKIFVKELMKKKKLLLKMIRDVMSNTILPYIKFVPKTSIHSIGDRSIAATIMTKMDIPQTDWHKWWSENQVLAEHVITEHKTKTTQAMKLDFNKGMTLDFIYCDNQRLSIT